MRAPAQIGIMAVQPPLGQRSWFRAAASGVAWGWRSGQTYLPRSWTTRVVVRSVKAHLSGMAKPAAHSGKPQG